MVTKGLATPIAAPADMPDRIYAIGDVHGHVGRLRALHAAIADDLSDRPATTAAIVHLGDYIDRGPDSAGCLELLTAGSPVTGVPCWNLLGNHESMLLDALSDAREAPLWLQNGGTETLRSWGVDPEADPSDWPKLIPPRHLAWLRSLLPTFVAGRYVFVHAGVRPGIRLAMQSLSDLLWIRDEFLLHQGPMLPDMPRCRIVHGHTPSAEPVLRPNRLGLDTNAGRGGKLTCAAIGSDSVYFLQA